MTNQKHIKSLKLSKRLELVLDQLESIEIFDKGDFWIGKPMGISANDQKEIPSKQE